MQWLSDAGPPAAVRVRATPPAALRALDVTVALALTLCWWPFMLLALAAGRPEREAALGRSGVVFPRWRLAPRQTRLSCLAVRLGGPVACQVFHVLRGDLAWVGPRARSPGEPSVREASGLRPGVFSLWTIRRSTAVDFGTEADADRDYLQRRGFRHDAGVLARGLLTAAFGADAPAAPGRVRVCDVEFDNLSRAEAIARLREMLDGGRTCQVSFVNPACVNVAARDRMYRRVLARAALVLPDGIGIRIACNLLGRPMKQNVNGTDLFAPLCDMLQSRASRVYFLGGGGDVPRRVAAEVARRWPGIRIVGVRNGYFSAAEEGEVAAAVCASGADVLFVARGVPLQDWFIDRHLHHLGVKVALGVGGLFDFVSGRISRAPAWMREAGLEWVYRLMQEPRRMWRRYVIGNAAFLARVGLQRAGLRRAQVEPVAPQWAAPRPEGVCAVLFAHRLVPADLPLPADLPAATLPLGHCSFAERTVAALAQAGVAHIHVVACDRPEALRRLLGSGSRWGVTLHWHLSKHAACPYGLLRTLGLAGARRVIVGHADAWIASTALRELAERPLSLCAPDPEAGARWAGWASMPGSLAASIGEHADETALHNALAGAGVVQCVVGAGTAVRPRDAAELLAAQAPAFSTDADLPAPGAAWLRRPWGWQSPHARLSAGARVEGPAIVGPGCYVADGASIGPHAVLTRDVVVAADTSLRDSIVMPGTLIGTGLTVCDSIVSGSSLQHVRLAARMDLPQADQVLRDMYPPRTWRPGLAGRAAAALFALMLAPWGLMDALRRRWLGLPAAWQMQPVCPGLQRDGRPTAAYALRLSTTPRRPSLSACLGALLDVMQGQRCWIGARPRRAADWFALNREWQRLLSELPVGALHLPAFSGGGGSALEFEAAADAYLAALRRHRGGPAAACVAIWAATRARLRSRTAAA